MLLFQLIGILLISITFYLPLANVVFSCDLAFNMTKSYPQICYCHAVFRILKCHYHKKKW